MFDDLVVGIELPWDQYTEGRLSSCARGSEVEGGEMLRQVGITCDWLFTRDGNDRNYQNGILIHHMSFYLVTCLGFAS
jgi:hypothetical protein